MKENKSTYLFFKLWNEDFGFAVKNILEAVEMQKLTPIPNTPEFMEGVFVFRGQVVPVINLRAKFKLPAYNENDRKYIIVSSISKNNEEQIIGFIVDKLLDVETLSEYNINNFPEIGSQYNTKFIKGIVKLNNNFIIILNIEKIISSAESEIIKKCTQNFNLTDAKDKKE